VTGGALTIFTNITAVLKLADWARDLVQGWKEWTHAFWLWAFGWLGIHLEPEWTPVLSFLLFGSLLAIGQAFQFNRTVKNQPIVDKYKDISFRLISWRTFFCVISMIAIILGGAVLFTVSFGGGTTLKYVTLLLSIVMQFFFPFVIIVLFARHRLQAAVSTLLVLGFFTIITLAQISVTGAKWLIEATTFGTVKYDPTHWASVTFTFSFFALMYILPVILLSVAPAKAISRRLIFLAIGMILLIALNELSKLGFDLTAPKLQG
jgi:hypothetical protein